VKDSGTGIRYQDQISLFKMFSKLSALSDMNKTGCGIGLTICKNIIERHGGEIKFES